jgi:hypothetical protein
MASATVLWARRVCENFKFWKVSLGARWWVALHLQAVLDMSGFMSPACYVSASEVATIAGAALNVSVVISRQ